MDASLTSPVLSSHLCRGLFRQGVLQSLFFVSDSKTGIPKSQKIWINLYSEGTLSYFRGLPLVNFRNSTIYDFILPTSTAGVLWPWYYCYRGFTLAFAGCLQLNPDEIRVLPRSLQLRPAPRQHNADPLPVPEGQQADSISFLSDTPAQSASLATGPHSIQERCWLLPDLGYILGYSWSQSCGDDFPMHSLKLL